MKRFNITVRQTMTHIIEADNFREAMQKLHFKPVDIEEILDVKSFEEPVAEPTHKEEKK